MAAPPPILVVVQDSCAPLRTPLQADVVLGRDPEATVPIEDGYLSRRHCLITRRGDNVVVRDLGSYNGTYVNGQRIHEECFLLPGDVLKIGRTRVFLDTEGGDAGEAPGALKVYAPDLGEQQGVKAISREKAPALTAAYRDVARELPPDLPRAVPHVEGESTTGQTRRHRGTADDKTPIPVPSVEDSAVARSASASTRPGSGVSRDREGMRAIAQIARVLTSVEDVHEFLDYTLSRILEVIPAERGIIMRLDPERRGLYAECAKSAVPGRDDQAARRMGISHTIAKKVVRERVSILVNDAVLDKRFKDASSVQDLQIRSLLCAPLWMGERISGLIYLDHLLHAYAFTEGDRDLLVAAANLAALGLERLTPRATP